MKKLVYGAVALSLVGCDQPQPVNAVEDWEVTQYTDSAVRSQISSEETELKQALTQIQSQDPSVKDIFYGVDDQGNKTLNVLKEDENGDASSAVWPLLGGMAAGALIANMISAGGVNNYSTHHRPMHHRSFKNREEEREYRGYASSAYYGNLRSRTYSSVKSNPTKYFTPRATISSRSSSVFSSSSSARSSGYSNGS